MRLIQVERQKSEQCQRLIEKVVQRMDKDGRVLPVPPALWAVSILSVVPAPAASAWQPVPAADPHSMPCSRVACKISRELEGCRCRTRTRQKPGRCFFSAVNSCDLSQVTSAMSSVYRGVVELLCTFRYSVLPGRNCSFTHISNILSLSSVLCTIFCAVLKI